MQAYRTLSNFDYDVSNLQILEFMEDTKRV